MNMEEPSGMYKNTSPSKLRTTFFGVVAVTLISSTFLASTPALASWAWNKKEVAKSHFSQILGLQGIGSAVAKSLDLQSMIQRATMALARDNSLIPSIEEGVVKYEAEQVVGDRFSTTLKFKQNYKGIEVVGEQVLMHFDPQGELNRINGLAFQNVINTEPKLTREEALRILSDRFNSNVKLSEPMELKIIKDSAGNPHLTYHALTRTTPAHSGHEVYLDAQDGQVLIEFERAYHAHDLVVYNADTDREQTDANGYPTNIVMSWYDKAVENGNRLDRADRSAVNAYRASKNVYDYYLTTFNRKSFDDQDAPLVSIVHIGKKMNNAFWTNEFKIMGYGDGDGDHLRDLTYGLDVAGHEITHAVTSSTARLIYAGESGALNESYSDFFGKMIDYTEGNWDIGPEIMAPKWNRRALRNMINPEEFKQPGTNDSPLKTSTAGPCTAMNDRCGVHNNSGIPNHASALIVQAIGKEKTEQIYYKVLTERLKPTSDFKYAREQTIDVCGSMFGAESEECKAVTGAFDAVKM